MKINLKNIFLIAMLTFTACNNKSDKKPDAQATKSLVYEGKTSVSDFTLEDIKGYDELLDGFSKDRFTDEDTDVLDAETFSSIPTNTYKTKGSVSGTRVMRIEKKNDRRLKIIMTLSQFNNGEGETLNGKITLIQTVGLSTTDIYFDNYHIVSNDDNIEMQGSIVMKGEESEPKVQTINLLFHDHVAKEMLKYDNFNIRYNAYQEIIGYEGRIYNSEKGYIDVTTPKPFKYAAYGEDGEYEVGTTIVYTGKIRAKKTIAYDHTTRVEIDYDNDGIVDEVALYDSKSKMTIPNREPVVKIVFPEDIYTNSDLSTIKVKVYDPDLDSLSTRYIWQINGEIVGENSLVLDNALFHKYDNVSLTVEASDDQDTISVSQEQEVRNSHPIIHGNFTKISLGIGETESIEYTITDADEDNISIEWNHYEDASIEDGSINCEIAKEDYDMTHPDQSYSSLSVVEKENFEATQCQDSVMGDGVSADFIVEKVFTAQIAGNYIHELQVTDGEDIYSKPLLESKISR